MKKFLLPLMIALAGGSVVSLADAEQIKLPPKAEQITFPRLMFRDVSTAEVVEFLSRKTKEFDPKLVGVPIVLSGPKDELTRLYIDWINIPFREVIKELAKAADLEVRVEGEAIHLKTKLKEPRLPQDGPPVQVVLYQSAGGALTIRRLEPDPK